MQKSYSFTNAACILSVFFTLMLVTPKAWTFNESPQTYTLDGQLFQSGTRSPLLDGAAKINVQILNPNGTCLLYEEQQTVNTLTTDGRFTIHVGSPIGSAKRTVGDPGRSMNQIFQNMSAISANDVPGRTCASGFYTPMVGDARSIRLIVTPSATNAPDTLTPDIAIDSVPMATVAQSVQGLERSGILQVNNSGSTALTQANLEAMFTTPAYANLQAILGGNFIKTDSSGAALPSLAADPAGASNGNIWFDSTTGQIKYQTSSGVQTVGAVGGGGAISSLTVGSSMSINGTVAGTISSGSGTIDLTNTGVAAGTYTKVTVDTKGRVTAGTVSLVESDIPNLTSAGKVSGDTVTSGTISGSTSIDTSGNLISTGTVSGFNVQATNFRVYNGNNYIQMAAPTLSGNVNLTLPSTDGNPNEFLKTDGNGILSWASASITSSDVTSALGYTPLDAAASFSGDVSGLYSAMNVDKIKGKSVTAATTIGQMMIYNGTSWVNSVVSGDATLSYDGVLALNKIPIAKGGTNSTSFGGNRIIASNATGSALVDFTCSLNQVITFDASGNAACANISSLSASILNGGNSTGADISVGTNDNKALKLKTNDTVAVTISQNGSVGIGTTFPSGILDVQGGTTSAANGTSINLIAQTTTKAFSSGGDINITAGGGTNAGGSVVLKGGAYGPYAPATITLGGQQWTSANISIIAGNNDTNATPGTLLLSSGSSANNGGGSVTLTSGSGNYASSGNIYIVPGAAGSTGTGNIVLGMASDSSVRGKVGIGVASPTAKLEVSGQVVSKVYNNGSATTFDFGNGNSQYTTASCGAMTLQNMVDGGSYTIAVQGATAGTCTFTDSAGSRTFKFSPANAATTANTHTLYSVQVMGSYVYVSWISGF